METPRSNRRCTYEYYWLPEAGEAEMKQTSGGVAVGNVVRLPQVRRMTGLGRSTIYRLEADRRFPRRIKLGFRAVGWLEREVQEWIAARVAGSRRKDF